MRKPTSLTNCKCLCLIQSDVKDAPRSPQVKEAPQREHRRFDEEGEIETIMERTSEGENEENLAANSPEPERSTYVKPATLALETPAVAQRKSSRRSSIGIPRTLVSDRTCGKVNRSLNRLLRPHGLAHPKHK